MSETTFAKTPVSAAQSATAQGIIFCPICNAIYGPAQGQEYLLKAPALAVEAAFMSMCHFCFRCRRPSCPQCWDTVHGICGACVHEVGLTFRVESAPLPGTLPLPSHQTQAQPQVGPRKKAASPALVCVQPGQIAPAVTPTLTPTPVTEQIQPLRSTEPVHTVVPERVRESTPSPAQAARGSVPVAVPSKEKQQTQSTPKAASRPLESQPPSSSTHVEKKVMAHATAKSPLPPQDTTRIKTNTPASSPVSPTSTVSVQPGIVPAPPSATTTKTTVSPSPISRATRVAIIAHCIELTLTWLFFLLFVALVVLILSATVSANANIWAIKTLHVDIRAELSYLWHLFLNILQQMRHG